MSEDMFVFSWQEMSVSGVMYGFIKIVTQNEKTKTSNTQKVGKMDVVGYLIETKFLWDLSFFIVYAYYSVLFYRVPLNVGHKSIDI